MKYLAIDSLARSGTTLLSSLINSQKGCATFIGNFAEPWHIWGRPVRAINSAYKPIATVGKYEMNIPRYKKEILQIFKTRPLFNAGKTVKEWSNLFDKKDHQTFDELYDEVAAHYDVEVIGFRWNQCLYYAPLWLSRSPGHYWVLPIRNPLDRIVSNKKTHNVSFRKAYEITEDLDQKYQTLIEQYPNNIVIVYYEDLVSDPVTTLREFFDKIDYPIREIEIQNIVGSNGKPYRNQGWRVKQKKAGIHTQGEKFTSFYTTSIGQYKDILSKVEIAQTIDLMQRTQLFKHYLDEKKD